MKVKIMKPWFAKVMKGWAAITLWPAGIYTQKKLSAKSLRHETIHWRQQREMLGLFFYLWYGIEYLIKYLTPPVGDYFDLGFEREAYRNERDPDYLKNRKPLAWLRFIKK